MASLSELKVQLTLTLEEMDTVVALLNVARDHCDHAGGMEPPAIIDELSTMYFDLLEQLNDGNLGDFEPE